MKLSSELYKCTFDFLIGSISANAKDFEIILKTIEFHTNTGFSIGGVAPVAYTNNLEVFIDKSISRFQHVFAAAGHPNCVFKINYSQLVEITNGSEEDISEWEKQDL